MSLLMNVLKSVLSPTESPAAAAQPQALQPAPGMRQIDNAELPAATADTQPHWRQLGGEPGVQGVDYGDIARPGVQRLFARPPRRLLDIGCCSGAVGAGLKQTIAGLWVWGCELSEAAERAAGRLDLVTRVPRAEWSAEDIERVRTVDTVLLLDVLEHMYNPWAELEFLAQTLPADAQVIVSMPNIGHLSTLENLAAGTFPYEPSGILDITHLRFFTLAGMQAMFRQTGFRVESTWILHGTPNVAITEFPAQVKVGKLQLTVDTPDEWDRLNAVQFGFRLRPQREAG